MVPEVCDPAVREIIVAPYRVIYRVTISRVEVVGVLDARMPVPVDRVHEPTVTYGAVTA